MLQWPIFFEDYVMQYILYIFNFRNEANIPFVIKECISNDTFSKAKDTWEKIHLR